jgi:hypothetical protein
MNNIQPSNENSLMSSSRLKAQTDRSSINKELKLLDKTLNKKNSLNHLINKQFGIKPLVTANKIKPLTARERQSIKNIKITPTTKINNKTSDSNGIKMKKLDLKFLKESIDIQKLTKKIYTQISPRLLKVMLNINK